MAPWGWSVLDVCWTLVALSSIWLLPHQVSAAPPEFDNTPYVFTLKEKSKGTEFPLPCSDPDSDATVVSLAGSITPTPPCANSFAILPCQAPATGFCLVYYECVTLSYSSVQDFSIPVECDDQNSAAPVSAVIDLRVEKNTAPRFDPDVAVTTTTLSTTKNKKAGDAILDLNAVDVDGDPVVFSMVTDPASTNFDIGRGDGIIRAKNDLELECNDFITFNVTVSDGYNTPRVMVVHATLDGANQRPDMTNLDVTLLVPENSGALTLRRIEATDDGNVNQLSYTLTASGSDADMFEINGRNLRISGNHPLDYETSLQDIDLTIVASDGSCTSLPRNVRVTITDVNEPPVLQPADRQYTVYEGTNMIGLDERKTNIPWVVSDEDFIDRHQFSIVGGNANNLFSIDYDTGQLTVTGDYDIDNNAMPSSQTLTVEVKDKGGLTNTTTIIINFVDKNDKNPVIQAGDFSFSVCEDKRIGATLGTLICTDDDLTSPNKDVYITGGGEGITVHEDGTIQLATVPALGSTISTTALCYDRGGYPGPLSSLSPVPISVTTVPENPSHPKRYSGGANPRT